MSPPTADPGALDETRLETAALELAAREPAFRRILDRWGTPPLWGRDPGFATLIHLILEQQVSLASAQAAMDRLVARIGSPEPEPLLALDDDAMLGIGFSRQKRRYARGLARRVLVGELDLDGLADLSDEGVRDSLTAVTGIGPWTADIYLLMALKRPDVWPAGDRALVVALRELEGAAADPGPDRFRAAGDAWRPWRSVAARFLWHLYLSEIRPPKRPT